MCIDGHMHTRQYQKLQGKSQPAAEVPCPRSPTVPAQGSTSAPGWLDSSQQARQRRMLGAHWHLLQSGRGVRMDVTCGKRSRMEALKRTAESLSFGSWGGSSCTECVRSAPNSVSSCRRNGKLARIRDNAVALRDVSRRAMLAVTSALALVALDPPCRSGVPNLSPEQIEGTDITMQPSGQY